MVRKITCLVLVHVLVALVSYGHAEVIRLKFANYFPANHMNSLLMARYCEELNKKLAGKVRIIHYPGGTLLRAPKMAAGVATGIADIGLSNISYTAARFPVTEVTELPLGVPSGWVGTHVANDFFNKFRPKEWDEYHVLMLSTCGPNVLQTVSKPVRSLEDIRGMRIRGQGIVADIIEYLGAVPVPIEIVDLSDFMKSSFTDITLTPISPDQYSEPPRSLRRGAPEGTFTPIETLKGFGLGQIMKYTTASWKVGSVFTFYVIMNKQKWKSLPPDVQKVFNDVSKEFMERWAMEWNKIDIEGRDFFLQKGGEIIYLSDVETAKWITVVGPVIADYKRDMTLKGYKTADIETWLSYVKERIEYWKDQEKIRKIPAVYDY